MLKELNYQGFAQIKEFILKEKDKVYKESMTEINETNKYCIGKLWLKVLKIEEFPYLDANVSVRLNLEPFISETKEENELKDRFSYDFNQEFLLYI